MSGENCDNHVMSTKAKPISIADAISTAPADDIAEDVKAWQEKKLRERHAAADAGRFASSHAVKAVIRKFIPDG